MKMTKSDRHELVTRNKILEIITTYQLHGELFGIKEEVLKDIILHRKEDLHAVTDEIYKLILENVRDNSIKQNPVD